MELYAEVFYYSEHLSIKIQQVQLFIFSNGFCAIENIICLLRKEAPFALIWFSFLDTCLSKQFAHALMIPAGNLLEYNQIVIH